MNDILIIKNILIIKTCTLDPLNIRRTAFNVAAARIDPKESQMV